MENSPFLLHWTYSLNVFHLVPLGLWNSSGGRSSCSVCCCSCCFCQSKTAIDCNNIWVAETFLMTNLEASLRIDLFSSGRGSSSDSSVCCCRFVCCYHQIKTVINCNNTWLAETLFDDQFGNKSKDLTGWYKCSWYKAWDNSLTLL